MKIKLYRLYASALALAAAGTTAGLAGANPSIPYYGYQAIVAAPHYPIVGETTEISVDVTNSGDADASNVAVQVSFNDWGVTFSGWQEIDTVLIPSIAAGATETVTVEHVFETRAHTCVEAKITAADENDDPNDDRGQINLEVIHSGENFSYGVPIRNEGDEPVELLLCGRLLKQDDPNGNGDVQCDPENQERIVLAPGEEVLFPVKERIEPGHEAILRVEAVNLLNGERNHVDIRIIVASARELKEAAMAAIEWVGDGAGSPSLRNRLANAARHVAHALESKSWKDENRLGKGGAAKVFAQEIAALNQLQKLLETDLDPASKDRLNEAAMQLADADRILAQTANNDAGGDAEAEAFIAQGDLDREAGNYSQAVNAYAQAWNAAAH